MAAAAQRNKIIVRILAKLAAEADVVNLKILRVPTVLASPAIALEYLHAHAMICCRIKSESP